MKSFEIGIPITWIVMALNQLANHIESRNTLVDLNVPSVEKYTAKALFGNKGDLTKRFDQGSEALVRTALTDLADEVSVEIYLIKNKKKELGSLSGDDYIEDAGSLVLEKYGFKELLEECAPQLL